MSKKLVLWILIGFLAGAVLGIGLWFAAAASSSFNVDGFVVWVSPFGRVLVSMLKMIVIPVIFLSLISGAASLPLKEFGQIGLKTIIWYLVTSLIAAVVGSILALGFNPGGSSGMSQWLDLASNAQAVAPRTTGAGSLVDIFIGMFENPFRALSQGNFLAVIVFSILFGLALKIVTQEKEELKGNVNTLLMIIEVAKEGVFKIVDWILAYSPIGVFALTAVNFAQYGSSLFGPYIKLTAGVVLGILAMVFVVYPLMMFVVLRKNPFRVLNKIKEAMLTAFVTRSSAATLPVSLRVAQEELRVNENLSAFSLPLGATINMDGVCIHLPMFAVLAANLFGVDLGFTDLALLVIITVLASVGAGGVPGGSLMLLFIILQNMGLSPDQIAVIVGLALGINPVLDMFETMNNVTGDLVCTYSVAEMENLIDKKK